LDAFILISNNDSRVANINICFYLNTVLIPAIYDKYLVIPINCAKLCLPYSMLTLIGQP